jgi:hypothetical protein
LLSGPWNRVVVKYTSISNEGDCFVAENGKERPFSAPCKDNLTHLSLRAHFAVLACKPAISIPLIYEHLFYFSVFFVAKEHYRREDTPTSRDFSSEND